MLAREYAKDKIKEHKNKDPQKKSNFISQLPIILSHKMIPNLNLGEKIKS